MNRPLESFECEYCNSQHTTRDLVGKKEAEGVIKLHCPEAFKNDDVDSLECFGIVEYPVD